MIKHLFAARLSFDHRFDSAPSPARLSTHANRQHATTGRNERPPRRRHATACDRRTPLISLFINLEERGNVL
jgi:hypothetical protein